MRSTVGRTALMCAGLAVTLASGSTRAADTLMPGKSVTLKPGKLAKGIFKPATTFPLNGDPAGGFANLQVFDTTAPGAGVVSYDLASSNWKALGNPPGSKGFKYKGAGTTADPCKVVLVKETIVKFVCKGDGITLAPPATGSIGAILKTTPTSRYCGSFGGTNVKNTPDLVKRKEAPAPGSCPPVPGPAVCGDTFVQSGEQCDDGNTMSNDGCSSACELETLPCAGGVIGERTVTVNVVVPPGQDLATARVTIVYPEILTGIPGTGDSSFVTSRISGTPAGGSVFVNDQEGLLTVGYVGLPPNTIPNGMTTQFVIADFDSCVEISRKFCNRNQQVIDCCNNPSDPMQANCPLLPPVCPTGQFPPPGGNPAPCNTVSGACPTEDVCVEQFASCAVSDTNDPNGIPVDGVTCTISVVENITGVTTTTSSSSSSTSSTSTSSTSSTSSSTSTSTTETSTSTEVSTTTSTTTP